MAEITINAKYDKETGLFKVVDNISQVNNGAIPYCNICAAPLRGLNYMDEFIWNGNNVTLPTGQMIETGEIEPFSLNNNSSSFWDNKDSPILKKMLKEIKKFPKPIITKKKTPKKLMLTYKTRNDRVIKVIQKWAKLNPTLKITLFDDAQCYVYLVKNYNRVVADRFSLLADGPIKADYFRTHYMFKEGGFYADVDINPVSNIENFISDDKFVTVKSGWFFEEVNPMFFSCSKGHIVLSIAIELYDIMFKNNFPYTYWNYSIVKLLSFINYIYPYIFDTPLLETLNREDRKKDFISDVSGNIIMYNRDENYCRIKHEYIN